MESALSDPAPQPQCIFCQISAGKVNSQKVYEDPDFLAVLDINPGNPGHCLVMTRSHYQVMPQIPDEKVAALMELTQRISQAMLRSLKAQGTTIFVANGAVAGQRAPHFMLHIIPRVQGDGISLEVPVREYSLQEAAAARQRLLARIMQVFGERPLIADKMPAKLPEKPHAVIIEQPPARMPQMPPPELPAQAPEPMFIWQKAQGAHLQIHGLPDYSEASVTKFIHQHAELVTVLQTLEKQGPQNVIELLRATDFKARHLLVLEYLGYLRILDEDEAVQIDKERRKNHPGRAFYAITSIGMRFLQDPLKPIILSNPVKEKILLEELASRPPLIEAPKHVPPRNPPLAAASPPKPPSPPKKEAPPKPMVPLPSKKDAEKFDLDKLTEMLGG